MRIVTKQKLANIMPCESQLCDFVSADDTLEKKLHPLSIHLQTAHPVQQHHQGGGAPRGKVDRPTSRPVSDLESWEFFRYEWANYKMAMGITGGTTSAHIYGSLDEELKRDLQKSRSGGGLHDRGCLAGSHQEVRGLHLLSNLWLF